MRQYLCEGATGGFDFIVDRSKPFVTESRAAGGTITRIPGRFSVCDCVNGNNRRYSKRVWEKNLTSGSILQEAIKRNGAFGLLEHPKDGIITLNSPISHQVTRAELKESRDVASKPVYEVVGEISLYDFGEIHTPEARKLRALIEGGYNPLVSSRGYGSLNKSPDGVDDVDEDYVCEGWDVVIKPSFEQAELSPDRSALSQTTARMAVPAVPDPTAESKSPAAKETVLTENLKESKPSSGEAAKTATSAPQTNNIMELKDIKPRIAQLESLDPSRLDPQRFAESVAQVEELHQAIAESATDPKQSWEAAKLHKALDRVSAKLSETVQAPSVRAKKLTESNVKLMKVINAVASTAVTYKKQLGEALKGKTTQTKLVEELTRRGQGWQKLAEQRKEKYTQLGGDFDTSCEALDIMAQRYHEDTTELARRLIVLEFKEAAQAPEIQKALKEATRLRHIAAIREKLEGKKPTVNEEGDKKAGVGKPADGEEATTVKKAGTKKEGEGECVADAPGKVTSEAKKDGKAAAPVAESAPQGPKVVLRESSDPRGLNESVEMVKRLSKATA